MKGIEIIHFHDNGFTATDWFFFIMCILLLAVAIMSAIAHNWTMAICNVLWISVELMSWKTSIKTQVMAAAIAKLKEQQKGDNNE